MRVSDGDHGEAAPSGHLVVPPIELFQDSNTQLHVAVPSGLAAEGRVLQMQQRPNVEWG